VRRALSTSQVDGLGSIAVALKSVGSRAVPGARKVSNVGLSSLAETLSLGEARN